MYNYLHIWLAAGNVTNLPANIYGCDCKLINYSRNSARTSAVRL